jgi:hypothetical protein
MSKLNTVSRGEVLWRTLNIFQDATKRRARKEMVEKLIKKVQAEKKVIKKA